MTDETWREVSYRLPGGGSLVVYAEHYPPTGQTIVWDVTHTTRLPKPARDGARWRVVTVARGRYHVRHGLRDAARRAGIAVARKVLS